VTPRARSGAFTLLELAIVLFVLAVLASGLAAPLASQVSMRRQAETGRLLDEAREVLLGFAIANGRLPCPASVTSRGYESFEPGADALSGRCSNFHDGFLPGATLGFSPLDEGGFVRDAWGSESNRIRYAVFGAGQPVNGVTNPLTRVNGMQAATVAGLGEAPGYLLICASGEGVGTNSCGAAANQLTRRAAFVLLSLGPNAATAMRRGTDESRNLDGNGVFVSREAGARPGNEFDDLLAWVPVNLLVGRLVAAGRLP
jgi:type II secretory pathway pseudopilin PulG